MDNKNLKFFSDSYKYDIDILNNLQTLLIQNQINKEFTLNHSLHSFLEEPFIAKNYVSLSDDNVSIYTNEELVRSINEIVKDYNYLLELFIKVNEERKALRKNNINLLQKLFSLEFGLQSSLENDFQMFLNKTIFMNYEFLKKYVCILEGKLSKFFLEKDSHENEMNQMKVQVNKLEKKLINSRESFKQYLITGKTDEETTPLAQFKTGCVRSEFHLPLSEDSQQIIPNESRFQTNDVSVNSKNDNISTPNTLTSNIRLSKVKENLKKIPQNKNNLNKNAGDNKNSNNVKPVERKKTATFHSKPVKNFMKKSSIDFTLRENAEENKENFKNNEKNIRTAKKSLTLSMSTTDFSMNSKKEKPKKPITSTKAATIKTNRSSIKEKTEKV